MERNLICHKIKEIGFCQDKRILIVSIKIPTELGWIDDVNCHFQNSDEKTVLKMEHKKNVGSFALFEELAFLHTCAYFYYFSFKSNGKLQYYQKSSNIDTPSNFWDDFWKLQVGFRVPDWVKKSDGFIIFTDKV